MNSLTRVASVSVLMSFLGLGCAGPQKAIDKHFAKAAVGQKYSELTRFGKAAVSQPLPAGATLYVHIEEYESANSTTLGIWGSREYSYKVTGFKVKDDVVADWAYGLFTPPKEASVLFGFEYGYDHNAAIAGIKNDYPNIMKTSTEEPVAVWAK